MNNKIKTISTVIFFGAVWGIIEATVGYVLHFLPIYIAGTILFPIVSFLLYKAYTITKSRSSLLAIGGIAAAIKAINFFMPFGSPFKIINPMLSIILESMMVLVVVSLLSKDDMKSKATGFIVASIGWRAMYLLYNGIQFATTGYVSDYLVTFYTAIEFTVLFGLLSAAIAYGVHYLDMKATNSSRKNSFQGISPYVSFATLAVAIVLTIFA